LKRKVKLKEVATFPLTMGLSSWKREVEGELRLEEDKTVED